MPTPPNSASNSAAAASGEVYVRGQPNGEKRSWHPDGRLRAEYRYERGALVAARAWTEAGKPMSEDEARALAQRDLATDDAHYSSLAAFVRAHLPRCDAGAPDRIGKDKAPQRQTGPALLGVIVTP